MDNLEYLERQKKSDEESVKIGWLRKENHQWKLEYRKVKALEIIARCQLKQTQIAEQSFKEARELRDYTMGILKKDQEVQDRVDKAIDERIKRVYDDEPKVKSKKKLRFQEPELKSEKV